MASFSNGIVFVHAPLKLTARVSGGYYADHTNIAGIDWNVQFSELRIDLTNNTDIDYESLDLTINPHTPIYSSWVAGVSQFSNVPETTFILNPLNMNVTGHGVDPKTAMPFDVPFTSGAFAGGFRMLCKKLPKHSTMQIVVALSNGVPPPLWVMGTRKKIPTNVLIKGSYSARWRDRDISVDAEVFVEQE